MEAIPSKSIGHVRWHYKRLSSTTFSGPEPGCNSFSQCYDKDSDPKGEKYDGCTNITVSGRTCQVVGFKFSFFCQAWKFTFPHSHKYTTLGDQGNNCRNPSSNAGGPWWGIEKRLELGFLNTTFRQGYLMSWITKRINLLS